MVYEKYIISIYYLSTKSKIEDYIRKNQNQNQNDNHLLLQYTNEHCIFTGVYGINQFSSSVSLLYEIKNLEFIYTGNDIEKFLEKQKLFLKKNNITMKIKYPFFQFLGYSICYYNKDNEKICTIYFETDYCVPYFIDSHNRKVMNIIGLLKHFLILFIKKKKKKHVSFMNYYYTCDIKIYE